MDFRLAALAGCSPLVPPNLDPLGLPVLRLTSTLLTRHRFLHRGSPGMIAPARAGDCPCPHTGTSP